jgi:hypothetical protein
MTRVKKNTKPTIPTRAPPPGLTRARGNLDEDITTSRDTRVPLDFSKKTKDQIVLALRTRIKSLRELREFLQIEERALVEKVNEEKKLRREKKDDGDRKNEQRESKE